jgi:predicted RNA-binding Zn-ribbon protein involved in translation (DUF1610 family)
MSCFNEKNQHIGKLVIMDRTSVDWDFDAVTYWCPKCGACAVYKEYDGRVVGDYAKMRFPEITRKALKNG